MQNRVFALLSVVAFSLALSGLAVAEPGLVTQRGWLFEVKSKPEAKAKALELVKATLNPTSDKPERCYQFTPAPFTIRDRGSHDAGYFLTVAYNRESAPNGESGYIASDSQSFYFPIDGDAAYAAQLLKTNYWGFEELPGHGLIRMASDRKIRLLIVVTRVRSYIFDMYQKDTRDIAAFTIDPAHQARHDGSIALELESVFGTFPAVLTEVDCGTKAVEENTIESLPENLRESARDLVGGV